VTIISSLSDTASLSSMMICCAAVMMLIVSSLVQLGACTDRPVLWISCCVRCCCTGCRNLSHLSAVNNNCQIKVKVTLRLTVSQSVYLDAEPHLGLMTRYLLLFDGYGLVFVGRPLWREDGSVFYVRWWPSPA
jgi:hypothetical protein